MSLSYMFSQLTLREQKDIVCLLFEAREKLREHRLEPSLRRFVSWVDNEYHRNKRLSAGLPPAPTPLPKKPEVPRTAWERLLGVMPHQDRDRFSMVEPNYPQ
jgi:hypothetical protein